MCFRNSLKKFVGKLINSWLLKSFLEWMKMKCVLPHWQRDHYFWASKECCELWSTQQYPVQFDFPFAPYIHYCLFWFSINENWVKETYTSPQMIPDREWSPNRTASDPGPEMIPDGDRKWFRLKIKEWHGCENGEDRELGWTCRQ